MILSTADTLPDKIIEVKGTVHAAYYCKIITRAIAKKVTKTSLSFLPFIKYVGYNTINEYLYQEVDERLKQKAEELGANAVTAIRYSHNWTHTLVIAHGTAVVIESKE